MAENLPTICKVLDSRHNTEKFNTVTIMDCYNVFQTTSMQPVINVTTFSSQEPVLLSLWLGWGMGELV
jgi:hypothetical protein